jgi:N-methylhydantoinase B
MIDHISLAVIKGSLEQITTEMDTILIRSAISPIIAETNDMANGIYHPITGETIAQGSLGLPVFLSNMQFAVQSVIKSVDDITDFKPGDVYILNDPYLGGTHLQDTQLVRPIFFDGELFCFLANTGHFMDIGGGTPGGWAPKATEIYQEGIIIPPVKLYSEGKLNEDLLKFFLKNIRLPEQVLGDIEAMNNALETGESRLVEVINRYGKKNVLACLDEMISRSEKQMASYILEIPDGIYRFEDYLDNDGVVDHPLKISLAIKVSGSKMDFDFTGTDPFSVGPMNLSYSTTVCACNIALKHIFPDVPVNGGTFKSINFIIPEGSILYAKPPNSVSGYTEVLGRVIDVCFGALEKAVPEKVPAASFGTTGVMTIGGFHPQTEKYFVGVFPYPGGYGGSKESDGLVHGNTPQSMANFMSIESSEHRYPVMFECFQLREGSAGAGYHRGGPGTSYTIRSLSEQLVVSVLGDRAKYQPFGISGGKSAQPNKIVFHLQAGDEIPEMVTKIDKQILKIGESIEVHSPGGGGYGDPMTRPPELVLEDLNNRYITAEQARNDYGLTFRSKISQHGLEYFELDK